MSTTIRKRLSWLVYAFMAVLVVLLGTFLMSAQDRYREANCRALMWKDVIDHTPSGVCVTDDRGYIIAWNDGAEKILGWTEDDVQNVHVNFLMTDEKLKEKHCKLFSDTSKLFDGKIHRAVCYVPTKDGGCPKKVRLRIVGFKNSHRCFLVTFDEEANVAALQYQMTLPRMAKPLDLKFELRK